MKLNREQVRSLAESCHIALTEREAETLKTELNGLLALTESLTKRAVNAEAYAPATVGTADARGGVCRVSHGVGRAG